MAKILVPVKRVPDYEIRLKINGSGSDVVTDGIKWIVNPFDEIAIEEAVRIKERMPDVEVVVVSIGPEAASEQLRTALAIGADRAILIKTDVAVDSYLAHLALAEIYTKEACQLVIMGKQAIDSDANQTGQLLASKCGLPQATFASKLEIDGAWTSATVTREVDGGLETIKVTLPAVVTTDLRLNEPRYPSLPNIVKAKKKPLDIVELSSLGAAFSGVIEPRVRIHSMELPPKRKGGVKVASIQELVSKLKDEAKVI